MKRVILHLLLLAVINFVFVGCANTVDGIYNDTKQNWSKLKKWDDKFQENYW